MERLNGDAISGRTPPERRRPPSNDERRKALDNSAGMALEEHVKALQGSEGVVRPKARRPDRVGQESN